MRSLIVLSSASLGKVIGLIWLPILILTVGSYFTMIPYFSGMAASLESGDMSQQALLSLRLLAFDVVVIVLLAVIAVAITREILNPAKGVSYVHFSFGMTELRVVGGFFGLIHADDDLRFRPASDRHGRFDCRGCRRGRRVEFATKPQLR